MIHKQVWWKVVIAVIMAAAAACSSEAPEGSHRNALLGVTDFHVRETPSELDIVGVDDTGKELAHFHLRIAMVQPPEWETKTLGREMNAEALGAQMPMFSSAGLHALQLPPYDYLPVDTFVQDPYVAAVLERWGVEFGITRNRGDEVEYSQCTELDAYPPSCMENGAYTYANDYWGVYQGRPTWNQKVVCLDSLITRVSRTCNEARAPTPCGVAGPLGCAVCPGTLQAGSSNLYAICQADVSTFYFANYNCGTPTLCGDNSECGCGSFCWQAMSLCL